MKVSYCTVFIILLCLGGCQGSDHKNGPDLNVLVSQALAPAPFGSPALVGATVSVAHHGKVESVSSFGKVSPGSAEPPAALAVSRVGSVTKMFTAALTLKFIDEGKIDLSTQVESLGLDLDGLNGITVENLLNMTSGLDDGDDRPFIKEVATNPNRIWSDRELALKGLKSSRRGAPGKKWNYANTNYHILALLIEKLGNAPFRDVLQTKLIESLGVESIFFPAAVDSSLPEPFLRGFINGDDTSLINPSYAGAAGALVSNGPDMLTFVRSFVRGKLVRSDNLKPMRQPLQEATLLGTAGAYGYGCMVVGDWFGHTGYVLGYSSAVFHNPVLDYSVAVLASGEPGQADNIFGAIAQALNPPSSESGAAPEPTAVTQNPKILR